MKNQSKIIQEVLVVRTIACLSIVWIHTLRTAIADFELTDSMKYPVMIPVLNILQMLLMYATPTFVFISEFVLSKSYGDHTPKDFLKKRVKYILLPYFSIGLLYSIIETIVVNPNFSIRNYLYETAKNLILADFYGYFLLVVFQFYLLHLLFQKFVYRRWPMKMVIAGSLLVNAGYLTFFAIADPSHLPFINVYIYDYLNKVPAFAWIAYFTIAFYCGKNYDSFKQLLNRNLKRIYLFVAASVIIMLIIYLSGIIPHIYSKRVDVLFYTIGMIMLLFHYSMKIRRIPQIIVLISQYSFGIFLIARFMLFGTSQVVPNEFTVANFIGFCLFSFVVAVIGSMIVTHLLNKTKFGFLIVGRIGVGLVKGEQEKRLSEKRTIDIMR